MDKPIKFIVFALIILIFTSCNKGVRLNISNKSNTTIDSLIVTNGYDKFKTNIILNSENVEGFLNFSDVPNVDGSYGLILFKSGMKKAYGFGYYTNGSPLCNSIDILIEKDTVTCKEILY